MKRIPPKCQIRSKDLLLYAGNSDPKEVHKGYTPSLNISDIRLDSEYHPMPLSQTPSLLQLSDPSSISDLSAKLQSLKSYQKQEPKFNLHFVKNSYIYTLTILTVLLLVTATLVAKKVSLMKYCRSYIFRTPPATESEPDPFSLPDNLKEFKLKPTQDPVYYMPKFEPKAIPNRTELHVFRKKRKLKEK